jgi:2-methylcitrate dehydratase PrpD
MSFRARVVMLVVGGVIFGGGTAAEVGKLMRLSSDDVANAVTAGIVGGVGLALLMIASLARDS